MNKSQLTVHEICSSVCETGRDTYLKRVVKVPEKLNTHIQKGLLIHMTYQSIVKTVKKILYNYEVERGSQLIDLMRFEGKKIDYDDVQAELKLEVPLSSLGFDSDIRFKSFLAA